MPYSVGKYTFTKQELQKYGAIFLAVLIAYLIDKRALLMFFFLATTMAGKIVRGQIANNMIMFDPLVFYSILIMKYWGFTYLFLYLFVSVFVADILSGGFSIGSFLNYVLFHLCPLVAHMLFGNFHIMIYGNVASLLYSFTYVPIRIKFLAGVPLDTIMKGVTNVIFVYLYIVFLGPIFGLLM